MKRIRVKWRCLASWIIVLVFCFIILQEIGQREKDEHPYWNKRRSRLFVNYLPSRLSPILIPKDFCKPPPKLIIMVHSPPWDVKLRNSIRNTWARNSRRRGVAVYFLMGTHFEEPFDYHIPEEFAKFKDIIQDSFEDSETNATLKTFSMLRLVSLHCGVSNGTFLLKVYRDTFVNLELMLKKISQSYRKENETTIYGRLLEKRLRDTDPKNRDYAPHYLYPKRVYPPYISGVHGYLMSTKTAKKLFIQSFRSPFMHLEDVFFTGICARAAQIKLKNVEMFSPDYTKTTCFLAWGFTLQGISALQMPKIFKTLASLRRLCTDMDLMWQRDYMGLW